MIPLLFFAFALGPAISLPAFPALKPVIPGKTGEELISLDPSKSLNGGFGDVGGSRGGANPLPVRRDVDGWGFVSSGEPAVEKDFTAIFDGVTLFGWRALPATTAQDWVVRDGILAGTGSQDRQSFLVWKEEDLTDFELELKYRLPAGGNTGIEIRALPDPSLKRPLIGYHADLGHAGIGDEVLGAWDFHFAGREEYSCKRGVRLMIDENGKASRSAIKDPFVPSDVRDGGWNSVRVVAMGRNFKFFINGKPASEFTDNATVGRFDSGVIALQIHGKGMRVEFKDIQLRRLQ